jgi:hypothetical protein
MELKHLIKSFTYRIEPKPEGGFVARAIEPSVPPLEAATREELQKMIQARVAEAMAAEFPGLKLPLDKNVAAKISLNLNKKTILTFDTGSHKFGLGGSDPAVDPLLPTGPTLDVKLANVATGDAVGETVANAPIVPESSNTWKIFRFLLMLGIVAALVYFFSLRR